MSANKRLRRQFKLFSESDNIDIFFPRSEFSTDNAAMIAYAGAQRLLRGECEPLNIKVQPKWSLEEISVNQPLM